MNKQKKIDKNKKFVYKILPYLIIGIIGFFISGIIGNLISVIGYGIVVYKAFKFYKKRK